MADREASIVAEITPSVGSIAALEWDSLAGPEPFTSHAFLTALEESGSVGPGTGWSPAPIRIVEDGRTLAAAPAYFKIHSQGEYVFDHGWAEAWESAGGRYYPKLLVAVPFTPVPGPRLLGTRPNELLTAIEAVIAQAELSSAHVNFLGADDARTSAERGWLIRDGIQYHWFNRGYSSFDDFLAALSSRKRKAIRRERKASCEGLEIETLRGAQIGSAEWEAMWAFYQDTGGRKWGRPYLTRDFFDRIARTMADRLLMFLARRDGEPVAGALNVIGEDAVYGRYWGCLAEVPFLHFELSYYRAIEWAIDHRLGSVQAGAQGEHKIARGYEPVVTQSAHYIPNPGFRSAVENFLVRERAAVGSEIEWLKSALPYRSSAAE